VPNLPSRIFLVRHGQTAWNAERRILGRTDVPLDATGMAQAAALARVWPRDAGAVRLVSSPLVRARATADAIAGALCCAVEGVDALVEQDQGVLEGLPAQELATRHSELLAAWREDPGAVTLPGGEAMRDVQARGIAALDALRAETTGTLIVVTHQIWMSAVLCAVAGEPLARWRAWSHRNTAWCELAVGGTDALRVLAHDVAPHLDTLTG
jgi:probable phosphoglycerate mutase